MPARCYVRQARSIGAVVPKVTQDVLLFEIPEDTVRQFAHSFRTNVKIVGYIVQPLKATNVTETAQRSVPPTLSIPRGQIGVLLLQRFVVAA